MLETSHLANIGRVRALKSPAHGNIGRVRRLEPSGHANNGGVGAFSSSDLANNGDVPHCGHLTTRTSDVFADCSRLTSATTQPSGRCAHLPTPTTEVPGVGIICPRRHATCPRGRRRYTDEPRACTDVHRRCALERRTTTHASPSCAGDCLYYARPRRMRQCRFVGRPWIDRAGTRERRAALKRARSQLRVKMRYARDAAERTR